MGRILFACALAAFGSVARCLCTDCNAAVIYNLGTLGGTDSHAYGVNSLGQVVGSSTWAGDTTTHAFFYDVYGSRTMIDLGALGAVHSSATAINDNGQIVGTLRVSDNVPPTYQHYRSFSYVRAPGATSGVMTDIGTMGGTAITAASVNRAGQFTGSGALPQSGQANAYRYTGTPGVDGQFADLGTFGGTVSIGNGINDLGQISGYAYSSGNKTYHAFLYSNNSGTDGTMFDLGTLGGSNSSAESINNFGQMAGWAHVAGNNQHAFLYSGVPGAGGAMVDLGTLGGTYSEAHGINNLGMAVGVSTLARDVSQSAFVYVGRPGNGGKMIDLNAWLATVDAVASRNWTLSQAYAINDSGLIVGSGYYNDGNGGLSDGGRAFVLDASTLIPEPSFLGFGAGIVALLTTTLSRRKVRDDSNAEHFSG